MPKIFSANAGRSGSAFLSGVFSRLTAIPSFHEPYPRLIGKVLEEVNDDRISHQTKRVIEAKIAAVNKASRDGWYCETSQQFIKCFADFALAARDDIYCIYIHRNPVDVVLSHFRHAQGGYPGEWLLKPEWKKNLIKLSGSLSWAELLLFNWLEVRERYLALKSRFDKVYEFDFRKIGDKAEYIKIFKHFGIGWKDENIENIWKNESQPNKDVAAQLSWMRRKWDKPARFTGCTSDYKWLSEGDKR